MEQIHRLYEGEGMKEQDFKIGTQVLVAELGVTGTIYESGMPDFGLERVFGVRLDKIAFPKNFVATEVWHCKANGLEPILPQREQEGKG